MKSLQELEQIRQETLQRINLRREDKGSEVRVVVGMATCGIAAGARNVMMAFMTEASKRKLNYVTISQTGCVGTCRFEPMADVFVPGQEKVTYVNLDEKKAARIVSEHIVNGNPVREFTITSQGLDAEKGDAK